MELMVSSLNKEEVKPSEVERTKPVSEWGSFQTQHNPGAQRWSSSILVCTGLQCGRDS